ncbi:hypothetical protein [uncultured Celeribacter sp.]|uniref:hypothetical protein n=1 Tax=uncultured Celeribacter sp. TaxID=1303376 RepID=UPI002AA7AADA|nr:hypothetical protein [uncultured Celeribacter sp.]
MSAVLSHTATQVPASSHADSSVTGVRAGEAKRAVGREGKIKDDGTMSGRFWKLLLSAHWLGEPHAALLSLPPRAAIWRNALALQGFERHHRPISACFQRFWPVLRT